MSARVIFIDSDGRHLFSGADDCSKAVKLKDEGTQTVTIDPPDDHSLWDGTGWVMDPEYTRSETLMSLKRAAPSSVEQLEMLWKWAESLGLIPDDSNGSGTPERMLHRVIDINLQIRSL